MGYKGVWWGGTAGRGSYSVLSADGGLGLEQGQWTLREADEFKTFGIRTVLRLANETEEL